MVQRTLLSHDFRPRPSFVARSLIFNLFILIVVIKEETNDTEFERGMDVLEKMDDSISVEKIEIKSEPLDVKPKIEPTSPTNDSQVFGKGAISHETIENATPSLTSGGKPYDPKNYASNEHSEKQMETYETPTKDNDGPTEGSSRKKRKSGNDENDDTGNGNQKAGKLQRKSSGLHIFDLK